MSAIVQNLITAEQFWNIPETDKHLELVRGQVMELPFLSAQAGVLVAEIAARWKQWEHQQRHGCVGSRAGCVLCRNPDTVRAPRIWFVRADLVPPTGVPDTFWQIAPDLAVEVVSPSESAADVQEKVHDYLSAGTRVMWVVYPRSQQVVVHTADGVALTLSGNDALASDDVLPGFRCTVTQIFE
jgi:Uma2 family endonuclease